MQENPSSPTRLAVGLWKVLALTCDEATRLVSDGFERELRPMERLALRMHLITCRPCRRMRAQFRLLREAGARLAGAVYPADVSSAEECGAAGAAPRGRDPKKKLLHL